MRPHRNQLGGMRANKISLDGMSHYPKVWHLPTWKKGDDTTRIKVLREIAVRGGHDPRIATLAVSILKKAKVQPRSYKAQAAALLKWVQNNIYYINEPSERLQDPTYTLKVGYGDCDDMAILLGSLYESIRLDWRFVLSGKVNGRLTRWIEGNPLPRGGRWTHIYLMVGYPPFQPQKWLFAEPTLRNVNLGWDVVKAGGVLPELGDTSGRILKIKDPAVVEKEEKKAKDKELKDRKFSELKARLAPSNLLTEVVVAAVAAVLTSKMVDFLEKRFFK